jgi:hypothetical protein
MHQRSYSIEATAKLSPGVEVGRLPSRNDQPTTPPAPACVETTLRPKITRSAPE